MHEQTIRLFWKVWIVWMSSTINIIINNSKKMTNYNYKMGTFSFRFLENFCQLHVVVFLKILCYVIPMRGCEGIRRSIGFSLGFHHMHAVRKMGVW